jgi:lipopolysaccharide transport system permease protein
VWNLLHPLATIGIYSLIFSAVFSAKLRSPQGKLPYTIYLCSGFFPWLAFSECVMRGCNAFSANAAYLKKLPVPEHVFVAQAALSSSLGLGINFSLLMVVSLLLGGSPAGQWWFLPIPLIMLQALGFGLGLLLGTLNVFFRDISQLLGIALQVIMWTVPIVYTPDILPSRFRVLLSWHPLMPAFECIRDLFLYTKWPSWSVWVWMIFWPFGTTILAHMVLGALRNEIRDVI